MLSCSLFITKAFQIRLTPQLEYANVIYDQPDSFLFTEENTAYTNSINILH